MAPNLPTTPATSQCSAVDRDLADRSTAVDQYLSMLRAAIAECGWTIEALATEMRMDKAHLSRLLSGEKPWRLEHLVGLPDDIEARFERKRAEHFGLIVVEPVDADTARRHLVSGLLGVLAPQLPRRADGMAKVSLPLRPAKAGLR